MEKNWRLVGEINELQFVLKDKIADIILPIMRNNLLFLSSIKKFWENYMPT